MMKLWRAAPLLLAGLVQGCASPFPHGSLDEIYPQPPRPQLIVHELGERALRVAEMQRDGVRPILFVHGSPGVWENWARYLDAPALAAFGPLWAVDRPGYGESDPGRVMPDLRAQAALLAALIPDGQRAVLVGHSLGGPLVAWMAIDHPDKVCGVVMVAGSLAAELEAPRWYNRFGTTWLGRWLAPAPLLWSNDEIMVLQSQLRRLDEAWPRLRVPVIALQGDRDALVDPRTADYLQMRAPAAWLQVERVPGADHFVLWKQPQVVLDAILRLPCGD